MANTNITPNMNLPNPVPGIDPGPDYASNNQSCFNILDQHNHSSGSGVQINPSGININAPLPFNGNPASTLQAAIFSPQASFSPLDSVYVKNDGNLYYNDGAGNVIQMTSAGAVNATSSGISSGSASASFSAGVLVVNSASNTPANIQCGSVLFGNNVAASKFVTVSAPAALGSNYGLVLPTIPASLSFLTIDSSGNMGTSSGVSGSQIASASITGDQIASHTLTQGLLALRATGSSVAAGGVAISTSCGTFSSTSGSLVNVTNLSVTIVTTGRPVRLMLQNDGLGSPSRVFAGNSTSFDQPESFLAFLRGGSVLSTEEMQAAVMVSSSSSATTTASPPTSSSYTTTVTTTSGAAVGVSYPSASFSFLDVVTAGTYTYTVQVAAGTGLGTPLVEVINTILIAYEI